MISMGRVAMTLAARTTSHWPSPPCPNWSRITLRPRGRVNREPSRKLDPTALTAGDVLAMATLEGARALGLDRWIGSLAPGKRADVVRLRGDRPGLANVHDPRQQVVYCTSPADVADVWVDGSRRVMDGHLVGHDLAALVEASRPLAAGLAAKAGLGGRSRLA